MYCKKKDTTNIQGFDTTVEFSIKGVLSLFSTPETSIGGEKYSYPIPTAEALEGILKNIYWHPPMVWVIDDVRIMKQMRRQAMGVNRMSLNKTKRDLASQTYMFDVEYQVRAHFYYSPIMYGERNVIKHLAMAKKFIKSGGKRNVYLGTSECSCFVSPCTFGEGTSYYDYLKDGDDIPLGFKAYYGLTYGNEHHNVKDIGKVIRSYWYPVMKPKGLIRYNPDDVVEETTLVDVEAKISLTVKQGDKINRVFVDINEWVPEEVYNASNG